MNAALVTTCPTCGQPAAPLGPSEPWQYAGFWLSARLHEPIGVAWSDDCAPLDVGRRYRLFYCHPFHAVPGDRFTIPSLPPGENFSDDPVADLPRMSLVLCEYEPDADGAPAARVLEIRTVESLVELPPQHTGYLPWTEPWESLQQETHGDWVIVSFGSQGDVGGWALCRKTGAELRMLVVGAWDFEGERFHAGHRPLSAREYADLTAILESRR